MNKRTVTFQSPFSLPNPSNDSGTAFLHIFGTDSGFVVRWIKVSDCPLYIRATTGEKARLAMSMTSDISNLPQHGKVVLTFEEILVCEDGKPIYMNWSPEEWFPYSEE